MKISFRLIDQVVLMYNMNTSSCEFHASETCWKCRYMLSTIWVLFKEKIGLVY